MNLIIKYLQKWLLGFFRHSLMAEMKRQTSTTTEKKRIARGVKAFFDRHYELRYNVIKQQEEFRPRRQDNANQENSDADGGNSNGQNFAAEHQNSCGKHQSATWPITSRPPPARRTSCVLWTFSKSCAVTSVRLTSRPSRHLPWHSKRRVSTMVHTTASAAGMPAAARKAKAAKPNGVQCAIRNYLAVFLACSKLFYYLCIQIPPIVVNDA